MGPERIGREFEYIVWIPDDMLNVELVDGNEAVFHEESVGLPPLRFRRVTSIVKAQRGSVHRRCSVEGRIY